MRCAWFIGMLIGLSLGIAQEVTTESQPYEPTVVVEPPYYSLKQLKQWIDQEKKRAQERLAALEQNSASLDPAHRHKLKEGPEYLEALWDYLYVRAYPNDSVDWVAYLRAAEQRDLMAGAFFPASGARWEFVGPRNTSPPHRANFGASAVSGRVNA
ncbi:MAG: hypothetical protein CFK48_04150, partial [Armatimonadetes bacterium CP1_7O]